MLKWLGKHTQKGSQKERTLLQKLFLYVPFCIMPSILLLLTISCVSTRDFANIDSYVYTGDFIEAQEQLEEQKEALYPNTDQVLYALDSGLLSHYNGNYTESNESLSRAEKLIEDYYAISITQTINSYLLNDTVADYAGEDFEDIYTNLFMALNYIQMGDSESAFVEIRRFNNKLQLLSIKYAPALEQARLQTQQEGFTNTSLLENGQNFDTVEFYDSAFARYVSLLLYRSIGRMDSANIDKNFIEKAFATQAQLYPFPVPKAVQEEFTIPNNKERLNVFAYTGQMPEKVEEVIRLPGLVDETWFKLAIPIMIKKPSYITSIHIEATDISGNTHKGKLELIESIENIAIDTFQQRQGLIYLKALLRSISKTTVNQGVTSALQQSEAAQWASVFNLAANLFTEFSEQADVRSTRYFPAQIWVGGLNLEKGLYDVTVTWYDTFNNVVKQQTTNNIEVKQNNVNLVEAVCLK